MGRTRPCPPHHPCNDTSQITCRFNEGNIRKLERGRLRSAPSQLVAQLGRRSSVRCAARLDRTDEWQLFEYISNFKGIQFLSGVLAMFQGTLMYMECAGLVSKDLPHTCDSNGPGMDAKAVCGAGVSNISCASVIGVGFFARMSGANWSELKAKLKKDLWPTFMQGNLYWSCVQTLNFKVLPASLTVASTNFFFLIWTAYLCIVGNQKAE